MKESEGGGGGQEGGLQGHISNIQPAYQAVCTGHHLVFHADTEVLSEEIPHDLFSFLLDFSWEGKGHSFEITCYSHQDRLLLYESFVYP